MIGVSEDIVEECRATILHNDMDLSRLMVHVQQVEESNLKKKNMDIKRARPYDVGTSKGKFEIQDKPKCKKIFSNQVPYKIPRLVMIGCLTRGPKKIGGNSPSKKLTCGKCGKMYMGECLVGTDN